MVLGVNRSSNVTHVVSSLVFLDAHDGRNEPFLVFTFIALLFDLFESIALIDIILGDFGHFQIQHRVCGSWVVLTEHRALRVRRPRSVIGQDEFLLLYVLVGQQGWLVEKELALLALLHVYVVWRYVIVLLLLLDGVRLALILRIPFLLTLLCVSRWRMD